MTFCVATCPQILISTIVAFILCLYNGPINKEITIINYFPVNKQSLLFLIPLMGWMPTAIDLSSWNSLWTLEKIKNTNYHPTLKETLFEFNFGYIISALLSICFLSMGAFLLFGTDNNISKESHLFANQVINLYTNVFGKWRFDQVVLDFRPDIVFDIRDYWMLAWEDASLLRPYFHWVIAPTVDSLPQQFPWMQTFANADFVSGHTDWAVNYMDASGYNINTCPSVSDSVDTDVFRPINFSHKTVLRRKLR